MKKTTKLMKIGLAALLLSTTASVFGQTTGTIDKGPLLLGPFTDATATNRTTALGSSLVPTYETENVVLFFNPNGAGSGLTLVASRTEDFTEIDPAPTRSAQDFTHYRWSYMGADNGSTAIDGTGFNANLVATTGWLKEYEAANDNKLIVTGLTEGYHYFKVQGYIVPDGAALTEACMQYSETFVVYVLPQLTVMAERADEGTGSLQYCETTAGSQTNVILKADVEYDNYEGSPALESFELSYKWYALKANADGTYPTEPTMGNIGALTPLATNNVKSVSNQFTPAISNVGTYKFFVEVEYTLKERDYDGAETAEARKRTYALYRDWVGGSDLASATEVFVTPAPGKPHITIENVQD